MSAATAENRPRLLAAAQRHHEHEVGALRPADLIGFMSDNHNDPDIAVEVFVLEPLHPPGA